MNSFESSLKLEDIYIEEIYFRQKRKGDPNLGYNVSRVVDLHEDNDDAFTVKLSLIMQNKDETTLMKICIVGEFIFEGSEDAEIREIMMNENAVAILFPYLRSQLTLLTCQPNMTPVILPVMNISAMLKDLETRAEKLDVADKLEKMSK